MRLRNGCVFRGLWFLARVGSMRALPRPLAALLLAALAASAAPGASAFSLASSPRPIPPPSAGAGWGRPCASCRIPRAARAGGLGAIMAIGGTDRGDYRGEYGRSVEGAALEMPEEPSEVLLTCEFESTDPGGVDALRTWLRGFPYAAALPVQPLMTQPTSDGLDVIFRKKPTKERGSTDGGVRIEVVVKSALWDPHRWAGATRKFGAQGAARREAEEDRSASPGRGRKGGEEADDGLRYSLLVRRISDNQDVPKVFSERILVNSLVERCKNVPPECGSLVSFVKNTEAGFPQ